MIPAARRGFLFRRSMTENRLALLAIIVEDSSNTAQMNALLHEYAPYIIGRMGIPYRQRDIALVSIAMDAPAEIINALTGRLGRLAGIRAKAVYSNTMQKEGVK